MSSMSLIRILFIAFMHTPCIMSQPTFLRIYNKPQDYQYPSRIIQNTTDDFIITYRWRDLAVGAWQAVMIVKPSGEVENEIQFDTAYAGIYMKYRIRDIIQLQNGNYVLLVERNQNLSAAIIELASDLSVLNEMPIGDTSLIYAYAGFLIESGDGGFVSFYAYINLEAYPKGLLCLEKRDAGMNIQWRSLLPYVDSTYGYEQGIEMKNGDYVFTGRNQVLKAGNLDEDIVAARVDTGGRRLWQTYYTYHQFRDYGKAIAQHADGSLLIAGIYNQSACVLKVRETDGVLIDLRYYGRSWRDHKNLNLFSAIQPTNDHGFILAGSLESTSRDSTTNVYIVKIDSAMNIVWSREYDFSNYDYPERMIRTHDGGYAVLGRTSSSTATPAERMFLLKTNDNGEVSSTESVSAPQEVHLAPSYPNPASRSASFVTIPYTLSAHGHVRIALHDALGREVRTLVDREVDAGNHAITFSAESLAPGIYFSRLKTGANIKTGKLVVDR